MGLFGYNEKTYNKNSIIFKDQLQRIYENLDLRGVKDPETKVALASVITMLDFHAFRMIIDAKPKQLQAVDDYIPKLIAQMNVSAQQRNTAKLVLQINMLNDLINDGRACGSLPCSLEDLQAKEKLNDNLGELNQTGTQIALLEQRKEELLKERARLEAIGANEQISKLRNEYMQIEANQGALKRKENELAKTYEYNCKALANQKDLDFYRSLAAGNFLAVNPQNLHKTLQEISKAITINNERVQNGLTEIKDFEAEYGAGAGDVSSSSGFDEDYGNMKAKEAMSAVNDATYTPGAASREELDGFDRDFKKFQG